MSDENGKREVGDLENAYDILGELGRGGSAIVYRARDRALHRDVAIKVVRPRFAVGADEALERLLREARTVARLQHPNIVTVHAVTRLGDGGLALVMQFVPGQTLKQALLDDGPFDPAHAERVLKDVAEALAYAHANGVVHRDVKPENIFLEAGTGRALLSDFGIAHSNEYESRLTMDGAAIGTPAYMAPEQIDGAPANARSDLYSLGLVTWEMLTGERPWDGEALYSVIFKQKTEELPAIDELRPGVVSPRLQYIVERMLQKKPSARWAGASGLLAAMDAWVVPSDWRQWEESHRRRRDALKAKPRAKTATADPVASATVRFTRPPEGAAPSAADLGVTAIATTTVVPDTEVMVPDEAPSWATEPVASSRGRRWATVGGLLLLFGGGGVATFVNRDTLFNRTRTSPVAATDSRAVELPIVSTGALDSLNDSTSRANGGDQRTDDARADSLRIDARARAMMAQARSASDSMAADSIARVMRAAARRAERVTGVSSGTLSGVAGSGASNVSAGSGPGNTPTGSPPAVAAPEPSRVESVRSSDDPGVVAAGGRHSCALSNGKVLCWGANDKGQLGNGDVESRDTPTPIGVDLTFAQVSTGREHSCAVARGGDAYCWGAGDRGQLGDATTTSRNAPVRVAGNLSFRVLRTGLSHSCGLTAGGEVACWGANSNGQVGVGSSAVWSSPAVISNGQRYISLSAGWNHTCAIATDGVAWCWGANAAGQLGNGTHNDARTPVAVTSDLRFTSISAGGTHTCAITDGGEAYCWGKNSSGQLGTGNTADQLVPTRAETSVRFASVSVGGVHSCARTRGGQAWCWGRNVYGQVGDGSFVSREAPTRVMGGYAFAAINATGAHSCGTATDGETFCWGFNVDGQLGDGTRNHSARPTRVTLAGR